MGLNCLCTSLNTLLMLPDLTKEEVKCRDAYTTPMLIIQAVSDAVVGMMSGKGICAS
jgi:hypothetical protein